MLGALVEAVSLLIEQFEGVFLGHIYCLPDSSFTNLFHFHALMHPELAGATPGLLPFFHHAPS